MPLSNLTPPLICKALKKFNRTLESEAQRSESVESKVQPLGGRRKPNAIFKFSIETVKQAALLEFLLQINEVLAMLTCMNQHRAAMAEWSKAITC